MKHENGTIGMSVDTHNSYSAKNNTATATTVYPSYSACGSRLPCGLCLITNRRCPMIACGPNITWTSGDITTNPSSGLYQPQTGPTVTAQSSGSTTANLHLNNMEKE